MSAYVLTHPTQALDIASLDAMVTFLSSFFIFVLCFGFFTRHRDEEVQRAARAEEADRSAAALRMSEERFRLQAMTPEHLDPRELLSGIEGLIRRTIDEDIEIGIKVAADVLPIEVDRGQLENAVLNL